MIASFLFLFIVLLTWIVQSIQNGFDSSLIPAIGSDLGFVIPNILFNYSNILKAC
jgi:hypothetical protein